MSERNGTRTDDPREMLERSAMMKHLLEALERGEDIGHYGRLTFVMVARFFMNEDEIFDLLARQPEMDPQQARIMVMQVQERDYNPPSRERILEWQSQQDFPICPAPDDPGACNVYRELQFPDEIYAQIEEFWEEKLENQQQPAGGVNRHSAQ